MGYYLMLLPKIEPQQCIERMSAKTAALRWQQEMSWAEGWSNSGVAPIHLAMAPVGKRYELESLSLWPADGVR